MGKINFPTIINKLPKKEMTKLLYETLREESAKMLAQLENILKKDLEPETAIVAERVHVECKKLVGYSD